MVRLSPTAGTPSLWECALPPPPRARPVSAFGAARSGVHAWAQRRGIVAVAALASEENVIAAAGNMIAGVMGRLVVRGLRRAAIRGVWSTAY